MRKADYQRSGLIFNIQKFSVNDGPGIRTVVFFKGCPLHCRWCANPESQRPRPEPLWQQAKCTACQTCRAVCPEQAISFANGQISINTTLCSGCLHCAHSCPQQALTGAGKQQTVQEVIDIVMQDEPFYEESGGGLTLSGGEFLAQPAFAAELLLAAKEHSLHTCCETTGLAQPDIFAALLTHIDYILFDLKHWDSDKHMAGTGATNELILHNLEQAARSGKQLLPRIPVIPHYNDSAADAQNFAACLQKIGLTRVQLLPFHQFGENKYALLGEDYAYSDVPALHREELADFCQQFKAAGIEAFF